MKKSSIVIGLAILVAIIVLVVLSKNNTRYKAITLSSNNTTGYINVPVFYDTVMSVALDKAGLTNLSVVVKNLQQQTESDVSLKAHVRYSGGKYYVFIDPNISKLEAIDIISHEVIHILQYHKNQLVYVKGDTLRWEGELYTLTQLQYDDRPWEKEAFEKTPTLSSKVRNELLY